MVYRFSVLPALSLTDGVLHCDIVEGAFDTATFYLFVERTLDRMQPFPAPNSVIVMDNCRIHKHPAIQELITSRSVVIVMVLFLLLMFAGACAASFCCHIHPTTIPSSSYFQL